MVKSSTLLPQQNLINGQWCDAASGKVIDVYNPGTGDKIGTIPHVGEAETHAAIDAAYEAYPKWAGLTVYERAKILRKWFELMLVNKENLALLMTRESGKPLAEARSEQDENRSRAKASQGEAGRPP